jgi:hypothetical protein
MNSGMGWETFASTPKPLAGANPRWHLAALKYASRPLGGDAPPAATTCNGIARKLGRLNGLARELGQLNQPRSNARTLGQLNGLARELGQLNGLARELGRGGRGQPDMVRHLWARIRALLGSAAALSWRIRIRPTA